MKYILNLVALLVGGLVYGQIEKPNIIFIFSDDQSFETIGANGQTIVETPNLDKLTKSGTTFTHAYNQGAWSGAVCMASRSMMISGAALWQAKNAVTKVNNKAQQSWPELMSEAGYTTYISGKWHVPIPVDSVFDVTKNIRKGMPKTTKTAYNRPIKDENPETAWHPWDTEHGGYWEGGKHWSEVLANDGIAYIEKAKNEDSPFFMYLAFNAPHDPRQAPKEYVENYTLDRIKLPENYLDLYPDMGGKAVPKIRDERLAPFPRTPYAIKVHRQEYYASITYMDAQIGRILEALEKSGKADNTYIIFTSDHGLAVGHHGLVGKQNMYEHSMRAPFIITGPSIKADKKIETPIYIQDAMATSLDLAAIKKPDYVAFKSVLPLLKNNSKKNYETIFGAYMGTQRMLIKDQWKLIVYPKIKKKKLFNLLDDQLEMHDLANHPDYSDKLIEMTNLLEIEMDKNKDPMTSLEATDYMVSKKKKH
ncbi:sulfatase-like hydrolase/transferase [Winogradskyella eckloniae]|uniref:sulfatase-like hydrolase/transferase n=1 Tax=Winogradskyella eckloniae TaxID=1089306 RepID=UPI0015652483|nr:sulfatase-like hydrolase/transferase [Winogradskyella eckloniae]NRD20703.1 sulfatase-like hydrolase/transferase [Winogradskyella eckloniae]